jgi:hypothetical protein
MRVTRGEFHATHPDYGLSISGRQERIVSFDEFLQVILHEYDG